VETALYILTALLVGLFCYRWYWLVKANPREFTIDFEAKIYEIGESRIAVLEGDHETSRSIICFPGFLEDIRYFIALYAEEDCQLILVNNAAYHFAIDDDNITALDCAQNPYPCGTIEYDGFHVGHILEKLATGNEVLLHGHSRGGAVVLEAGRQYPHLTRDSGRYVRAVLEAPVLPGAKAAGGLSRPIAFALTKLLLPIFLGLSRKAPVERLMNQPRMQPSNPLKTEICGSIFFNPIQYATCVTNIVSIRDWQRDTSDDVYSNYDRVDVVMGARDDVLDNASMAASAERGAVLNESVNLLRTQNTSHFVTLEQPEYLRSLL
jgi:pimeloyl-ACP methyl ester carboxylesterase